MQLLKFGSVFNSRNQIHCKLIVFNIVHHILALNTSVMSVCELFTSLVNYIHFDSLSVVILSLRKLFGLTSVDPPTKDILNPFLTL